MVTKMKNRIFAVLTVVALIALGVLSYWFFQTSTSDNDKNAPASQAIPSKGDAKSLEGQTSIYQDDPASKKTPAEADLSKVDKRLTPEVSDRIEYLEKRARTINGPIEFYGRIVDQYDEPVIGARVTLEIDTSNESLLAALLKSSDDANIFTVHDNFVKHTDRLGKFAVRDKRGNSLMIDSIEKEGYVVKSVRDVIDFDARISRRYQVNVHNPKVYQLWKKGETEPLINVSSIDGEIEGEVSYRQERRFIAMEKRGRSKAYNDHTIFSSPIFFFQGYSEKASMVREPPGTPKGRDWWIEVGVVDGGLQKTKELYPYLAPNDGYRPTLRFGFKRGDPEWKYKMETQVYFKSASNYGTCKLRVKALHKGDIRVSCENIYINPNGSRNLEPDKSKLTKFLLRTEAVTRY